MQPHPESLVNPFSSADRDHAQVVLEGRVAREEAGGAVGVSAEVDISLANLKAA